MAQRRAIGSVAGSMAAALALAAPERASADPAFGFWLVENRRAIVEIHACGEAACGRLAWLMEPHEADGRPKTDMNNPDPALRSRTLCGLPLIRGLAREEPGAWAGGEIYNARDGSVYGVRLGLEAADRLEVRGFLGISLFGRSQIWSRAGGDRGGCTRLAAPGSDR